MTTYRIGSGAEYRTEYATEEAARYAAKALAVRLGYFVTIWVSSPRHNFFSPIDGVSPI